ncbi:hypothetical protein [Cohnella nanjingensis]|uniref:Uncharacterized protein n=1 Tax=Cohnella nanjingensis TaxID=1387779 RepID=A0A7X0VIY7_9BACL|nr:hypothetical protein [Cohnella nanjingensis]MBB6674169.1 hypothetical protein [Cohnella nanjingensis]
MLKHHKPDRPEYLHLADKIGRRLLQAAAALAIALVLAQGALHVPALRHLLTVVDSWEGIPYRTG